MNRQARGRAELAVGTYLRLIDFCITQLKAQGPSRTCNESKEEEEEDIPEEASQTRMEWSDDPDMIRFPSRVYTTAFTCGKIEIRLPGKVNSKSHGTRPVHLIISMIKWIRTSRLSIKESF